MKKEPSSLVSIQYQTAPGSSATQNAVLFLCRFFLFSFASLGFLLSFLLILSSSGNFRTFVPWGLLLSLFFALVHSLPKPAQKRRCLLIFCVFGGFLFYLKRSDFLQETQAFLGKLNELLENSYELSFFPPYGYNGEDYHLFLPAAAGVFLLLFYLATTTQKTVFILLLLVLPPSVDFFLNVTPTVVSLGFLLAAFLFWNILKHNPTPNLLTLATPCCTLFLYFLCATFLVPVISPSLFQWRKPLYTKVNEFCQTLFEPNSIHENTGSLSKKEQVHSRESLNNTAPVHRNETMFFFSSDSTLTESVYLRGFVGTTYSGTQWKASEEQQWEDFLNAKKRIPRDSTSLLYNIPFVAARNQNTPMYKMTLSPAFSPAYSYLPWGVEIPNYFEFGESNELKNSVPKAVTFSGIPLSLSHAEILENPALSSKKATIENFYNAYASKYYMEVPRDRLSSLFTEIQKLPVFQSMEEQPSVSQIQDAAQEIQNFLWEHASYSLALEPLPFGNEFVEDFLFRQHQGFCVHFATAGTLLFRMYGIPARYVSGYVIRPGDLKSDSNGQYSCQVTDASAHAWAEIYVGKGGWIPVEVTPAASDITASLPENQEAASPNRPVPEPTEKVPENSNEAPAKDSEKKDSTSLSNKEISSEPSPFASFLPPFLSILRTLFLFFIGTVLFWGILLVWRTLCFKKHLGYFAVSSYDCFQTIFRNLLRLWERLYGFSSKGLSDQEFFRIFKENLPEKEKKIFLEFYQMLEAFTFGQEKPEKKQLRDLRTVYGLYRKKLLKNSSPLQRFYICYLLGL